MPRVRLFCVFLVLSLVVPVALAGGGDAGTGADAGGSPAEALPVGYGSFGGYIASRSDADWFSAPGASGLACVEGAVTPLENPLLATVGLAQGNATRARSFPVGVGATQAFGVAGSGSSAALLGLRAWDGNEGEGVPSRPGPYAFAWRQVGVAPAEEQDAWSGRDAPSSPAGAPEVGSGCVPGRLDPLSALGGDDADAYRLFARAGERITFSLAAPADAPVALTLVDEAGEALTPAIGANGMSTYAVPSDGSYSLLATRSALLDVKNIEYLIGVVVGPPGCKPNC